MGNDFCEMRELKSLLARQRTEGETGGIRPKNFVGGQVRWGVSIGKRKHPPDS